ncbi:MAG: signal peptidase II [Hyphomicrobiales bacterium]
MEDASAREPASAPRGRIALRPSDAWFLLLAAAAVGADQLTKWIIRSWIDLGDEKLDLGLVRLVHITNSGAAFGMFQDAGPLLAVTSIIGMTAILIYLFNPGFAHPLMRAGLALMLGGAIGNLIDRLRSGEVVDFIKVPNFPAFNVADSCITIGVLLLLWTMLWDSKEPASGESS